MVDQTYDGTSANAQSGVAIAGAKFLQNEATQSGSSIILQGLTKNRPYAIGIGVNNSATDYCTVVGATATTTGNYSTSIGYYARTSSTYATALGNGTYANAQYSLAVGSGATTSQTNAMAVGTGSLASGTRATALGSGATARGNYAIQLGYGTNDTANTLNIGFYNSSSAHYNWQLLDGTTGLIPDARISSNIARTSQIPSITVDQTFDPTSTNAQSGVAIAGAFGPIFNNFVVKNVGNTNIENNGTDISCYFEDDDYYSELQVNDATAGLFYEDYNSGGSSSVQADANGVELTYTSGNDTGVVISDNNDNVTLTVSNSNLAVNGSEVVTGDNTRFDGQWVTLNQTVVTEGTSLRGSTNLSATVNVPNDGHTYEVLFRGSVTTGSSSSNYVRLWLYTNTSPTMYICGARTRSNSTVFATGSCIAYMTYATNNLTVYRQSDYNGTAILEAVAYRRVGTNT